MTPEALFGDITDYVQKANAMLAHGEWVDLAGLDKEVEALCAHVVGLSPEQAREYAPELEYVREQVGLLEQSMRALRDGVKGNIKGTETIERANKAYAQGTSLSPTHKP